MLRASFAWLCSDNPACDREPQQELSLVLAQLAMLGATCSYGFAAVYGRQFRGTPNAVSALSTALAFIIWFRLILTAGASNTSLVTFLIPITALALGIFVLGEEIGWTSYVGLLLILTGLAVAQARTHLQRILTMRKQEA